MREPGSWGMPPDDAERVAGELQELYLEPDTRERREASQAAISRLFAEIGVDRDSLAGTVIGELLCSCAGQQRALDLAKSDPEGFEALLASLRPARLRLVEPDQ